jgi:hypothetical protein
MRRARPYSQSRENLPRNYYCDHKAEYVVALHCGVMGPLLIHINECRRSSGMSLCVCTAVGRPTWNVFFKEGYSTCAARSIRLVRMSTLSQDAKDIFMTHRCPRSGHGKTRQASSFRPIRHYQCSACGEQVRLTYNDKLKLFREHAVESESAV